MANHIKLVNCTGRPITTIDGLILEADRPAITTENKHYVIQQEYESEWSIGSICHAPLQNVPDEEENTLVIVPRHLILVAKAQFPHRNDFVIAKGNVRGIKSEGIRMSVLAEARLYRYE